MTQEAMPKWMSMSGSFMPFTWPQVGTPAPAIEKSLRGQQEFMAAALRFAQESIAAYNREFETAGGIFQRMMSAKSPEDFFAGQRDLFELMGSTYFEQAMKLAERMQGVFVEAAEAAAKPAAEAAEAKKAA